MKHGLISTTPFRAASHFGLGASAQDLAAIGNNPVDWVVGQLQSGNSVVMPGLESASSQIASYQQLRQGRQRAKRMSGGDEARISALEASQRAYRVAVRDQVQAGINARLHQAVSTPSPVRERLAQFWSNHFTVSRTGRPQIATACTAYENEAIRPALDGHFAEMLLRVVSHPVMLLYLDNAQSVGPRSVAGKRRDAGLNENLAREILELHTLGVDGGYTQADVTSLARILTGWTLGSPQLQRLGATPGEFIFAEFMHEPGSHLLLGKEYRDTGAKQGVAALRDLGLQPATARFVARKLVTHFVNDEPAARDVDFVAKAFLESDGHLPRVHRAVLTLSSAWNPENQKLKTPWELLVSTLRGLALPANGVREFGTNVLRTMNHLPFSAPSPAGWPDTMDHWGSPTAIKQRIEWGVAVGRRLGNRMNAMEVARHMIDSDRAGQLMQSIARAESPAQGLALLLSSPNFQWR